MTNHQFLEGHSASVNSILWDEDAPLRSCADDGDVREWDVKTNSCKYILRDEKTKIKDIVQSKNIIVTNNWEYGCRIWRNEDVKLK